MRQQRFWTATLVLLLALAQLPASHAARTTAIHIVTNTNDSGAGSLRWAINQANSDGEESIIMFAIPGAGVHTIQPLTPLPALVEDSTQIRGDSQAGWAPATDTTPATIVVEIDGSSAGPGNGFSIASANNWIAGLAINSFDWSGIAIVGSSAMSNAITGNHIGTDASGQVDRGNDRDGVSILLGAHDNTIGGDEAAERNVISGNGWDGIGMVGDNTTGNVVLGNFVGSAGDGWSTLDNDRHGVHIYGGAHHNTIGAESLSERNVISGNDRDGVHITGENTRYNVISGNFIGLNYAGGGQLENRGDGVLITGGAHDNAIGGGLYGSYNHNNVISGNAGAGVVISGTGTMSNTVYGNFIGPTCTGALSRDNLVGVKIVDGARKNTIGGDTESERNVISGNQIGVVISGTQTSDNVVAGNYIGTTIDGTGDMGNIQQGVHIYDGAHDNTVGPNNVISGNDRDGILIDGGNTSGNFVLGNYIGGVIGAAPLGNLWHGVRIRGGAHGNTVGGDTPSVQNTITGNRLDGVYIYNASTMSNTISGNEIWGNIGSGILISGAQGNAVEGNYIGSNGAWGVAMVGLAQNNTLYGNRIGFDRYAFPRGNGFSGILLDSGLNNTIGGDTLEERNFIAANGEDGIHIRAARDNTITGNYIGTSVNGEPWEFYGNVRDGIRLDMTSTGNIIGGNTAGAGNIIAGNEGHGVHIIGASATGNVITRNSIFSNTMGISLTNGANGGIAAPAIAAATWGSVHIVGTAAPGCTVEVFENSDQDGEGETYVGDAVADGNGTFTVTVGALTEPYLTATATDAISGTSEFSAVYTHTVYPVFLPLVTNSY